MSEDTGHTRGELTSQPLTHTNTPSQTHTHREKVVGSNVCVWNILGWLFFVDQVIYIYGIGNDYMVHLKKRELSGKKPYPTVKSIFFISADWRGYEGS